MSKAEQSNGAVYDYYASSMNVVLPSGSVQNHDSSIPS